MTTFVQRPASGGNATLITEKDEVVLILGEGEGELHLQGSKGGEHTREDRAIPDHSSFSANF